MFKAAVNQMKTALILLISLMLLTGLIYPLIVTGLAQFFFPTQANGSLIQQNGLIIGSRLIGQSFSSPAYFWGRPSATTPFPYNGGASLGSNSGPSNPGFLASVKDRVTQLNAFKTKTNQLVPVDLVTTSGSGLDPEISPYTAFYQVARVAKTRHIPEKELHALIISQIKSRTWGILGEPRVNVLQLNLALDNLRTGDGRFTSKS